MSVALSRRTRIAALVLLVGALGACGDDRGADGDTASQAAVLQWRLDYANCMRSHGIEVKDPEPNGAVAASGPEDETPQRQAAEDACRRELGAPPVQSGGDTVTNVRQEQLDLAKCLRDKGISVDDPAPGDSVVVPENLSDDITKACGVDSVSGVAPR